MHRSGCVASRNLCIWRYAGSAGSWCLIRSGYWECEADVPSCGRFVPRTTGDEVLLKRRHMLGRYALPGVRCSGRKGVVPRRLCVVWGIGMAQTVRVEIPGFASCRGSESGGWLSNNQKDGREVQVCFGHGQLSGSGSAFGSCSSQGLPVRSRNALQWCRVRKRQGEAQKD